MAQPALDDDDDKPLDPAVERVRRKLVRFALINLGILFAALIAVVAALVYKGFGSNKPLDGTLTEAVIALPAGARMTSHDLADGQLAIAAELADGTSAIFLYDLASQKIVGRYTMTAK